MSRAAVDPQTHRWSEGRAIRHLQMLVERFPGTSAAERAKAELARIAGSLVGDALSMPPDDLDVSGPLASLPTASHVDTNEVGARAADGSRPANVEPEPNDRPRSLALSQEGQETRRPGILACGLGLIALVAISLCIARWRAIARSRGGTTTCW